MIWQNMVVINMSKYNIYVGLEGEEEYSGTCNDKEKAVCKAHDIMRDKYEKYAIYDNNLRTYDECVEDYCEVNDIDYITEDDYDEIDENYVDEVESYMNYFIKPYEDDPIEEDKYYELD